MEQWHGSPILLGALLTLVLLALSHPRSGSRPAPYRSAAQEKRRTCEAAKDLIHEAVSSSKPPQLPRHQLHWIADELYRAGLAKGAPTNLLVFGLGRDSVLWHKLNCLGRTVFLEDNQAWIDNVLKANPSLEYNTWKVAYNTTVATAGAFFQHPWSLLLPGNVSGGCYDVILVDAPPGDRPAAPGRMQSAQRALELASQCVSSGILQKVVIFLHDVHRPLEQRIAAELFRKNPNVWYLGRMQGDGGKKELAAFEFSNNLRI